MPDVFISYARKDIARIPELLDRFRAEGWDVFWDYSIPPGKDWRSWIGKAFAESKCVVVCWSHHAIISDWVLEEAEDARKRGILIPCFFEQVTPPMGFRKVQGADLSARSAADRAPQLDALAGAVGGLVGSDEHASAGSRISVPTPLRVWLSYFGWIFVAGAVAVAAASFFLIPTTATHPVLGTAALGLNDACPGPSNGTTVKMALDWCAVDQGPNEGAGCGMQALGDDVRGRARAEMMRVAKAAAKNGEVDRAIDAAICCQIHTGWAHTCLASNRDAVRQWLQN